MKEAFGCMINRFWNFFNDLNDQLNKALWHQHTQRSDRLYSLQSNLEQISYKSCKDEINKLVVGELNEHYRDGKLKDFYSKICSGEYYNQVFTKYGDVKQMQSELSKLRDSIEQGSHHFNKKNIEDPLNAELKSLQNKVYDGLSKDVLQPVQLDVVNPGSSKVRTVDLSAVREPVKPQIERYMRLTKGTKVISISISPFR